MSRYAKGRLMDIADTLDPKLAITNILIKQYQTLRAVIIELECTHHIK